mmetsp:Transcript_3082/g.10377  ORF Transcript_3082/g.10377 Transcript_3082/m.10377 type:complete len:217 (+) Transcript_3082:471-1121(+)
MIRETIIGALRLDVPSDDAVQRLAFCHVIRVRCIERAILNSLVDFVRVLDDALAVDDAHLLLNGFVNIVVELLAILLLLTNAQELDNLFVRRRDRATHGAEFRAALVRASQNGVIAIANDERGTNIPSQLGLGASRRRRGHAKAVLVVLRAVQEVQRAVVQRSVPQRLFNHLLGRIAVCRSRGRSHGCVEVRADGRWRRGGGGGGRRVHRSQRRTH